MASTVASRGVTLASLLKKLLADPAASAAPLAYCAVRPATVSAAHRTYNTQCAQVRRYEDDESSGENGVECDAGDRRRARDYAVPSFFSQDVLDPSAAPTSLGRLLALLEEAAGASGSTGFSSTTAPRRGWWVAKDDENAVYLKVPMPGLGKEHVKMWAEQNSLVIKGEGEKEPGEENDDAPPPRYSSRIEVPADAFKMDKIKAEMKNGVLRVTVPKVKEEDRKDVFQVKVE